MPLVIDASYTIALALQEAGVPEVDEVGRRIVGGEAVVPSLWRFEVANVLLTAVRRKRLNAARPGEILADLDALPIRIDDAAARRAWIATLDLADRHGLTVYNAAYLELAARLGAELASLDGDLVAAARREGVGVIGG